MKLEIPHIVKPVSLSEYAPEMDAVLHVWVNPPRAVLLEYYTILEKVSDAVKAGDKDVIEAAGASLMDWFALIWSAGGDAWTGAEVKELSERCMDTDPALWGWLTARTYELITEHRADAKKK